MVLVKKLCFFFLLRLKETFCEKNLSTKRFGPQASSWFPSTHANSQWPSCLGTPPCKGTCASFCIRNISLRPLPTLKKRKSFKQVGLEGEKWVAESFILQGVATFGHCDHTQPSRIGYTVSRKVGSAVVRNKVRRRLREAVSVVLQAGEKRSCDYVLIARPVSAKKTYWELVEELRWATKHLHRLMTQKTPLQESSPS